MSGDAPVDGLDAWPGPADGRRQVHLLGFMGCGKSTVGRLLARRLVWSFLDLDALVERHAGRPIAMIFADQGESGFRAVESFVLRQAVQKPGAVVALGGGTVLDPTNRALCQRNAVTVWLRCTAGTLRRRLGPASAERPLWHPDDLETRMSLREAAYRLADFVVDADGAADQVAELVLRALRGGPRPPSRTDGSQ